MNYSNTIPTWGRTTTNDATGYMLDLATNDIANTICPGGFQPTPWHGPVFDAYGTSENQIGDISGVAKNAAEPEPAVELIKHKLVK